MRKSATLQSLAIWCLLCLVLWSPADYCNAQQDSVKISGSPEFGNTRNQLLERMQYRQGKFFRNDFIRDYSPFDERTFKLESEPSFGNELLYRDQGREKQITLTMKENFVTATLIPLLGETFYANESGTPYWKRSNGLAVSGSVGEDVTFYAKAIDNVLRGASPNMISSFSSQPGYVTSLTNSKGYDYDDAEMQLGFRFGQANLFFEKIRNTWGYGRGGQLVFSERAPSYPQIRASVQLFHNVKFTVLAEFLNSRIVDSSRSYIDYTDGTLTDFREVDRSKYLFAHILEYSPIEELNLAIGEEIIVSDSFTPEYMLLPFTFYHNLYIQAGGTENENIWGGGRYTFKNVGSIYSTLYVDDFNIDQRFYIVAGTFGGTLIDIDNRKLDLTLEYTALRPFVYANNTTALSRTSNGYPLGDWLGQNGERMQAWVDYRPIPELWFSASYMNIRKGLDGTTFQEYGVPASQIGDVKFLDGPLLKRSEFNLRGRWEMHAGLVADFSYRLVTQKDSVVNRFPSFSNRSYISVALKLNIFDQNDEW